MSTAEVADELFRVAETSKDTIMQEPLALKTMELVCGEPLHLSKERMMLFCAGAAWMTFEVQRITGRNPIQELNDEEEQ